QPLLSSSPTRRSSDLLFDIAHIAVALALHPGPALSGFENQHVVAIQELSVDAGICPGRLANVSHRNGNAGGAAGHEAIGRDLSSQADISEIGAKGMHAWVAGGQFFM